MLMLSPVVPTGVPEAARRRRGRRRSSCAALGATEWSQLVPGGRGVCGLRLLGSFTRRTVASGNPAVARRGRQGVVQRRLGRSGVW